MATGDGSSGVTRHSAELHDATGRRRAEEEVRLLLSITQTTDATENFQSALEAVLREVCGATGWDYGEAWLPHPSGTVLQSSPAWHGSTDALTRFRLVSEQITFPPGDGLPGRVWSSKQPEWIEDLWTRPDTVFFRASAAQEAGLKAGLGIPITANGEVLAVLVFFVSEPREEDGRLLHLISAVAQQLGGLMQRRPAEEALRESEANLADIAGSLKEVVWSASPYTLETLYLNVAAEAVYGRPVAEFLANTSLWFEIIHPEDRERVTRHVQASSEGDSPELEYRILRPDGEVRWLHGQVHLARDASGQVTRIVGITTDISERRRAEEVLRERDKRSASLVEAIPDMMFTVRRDGTYLDFVPAEGQEPLFPPSEFLGRTVPEVMPAELARTTMRLIEATLESGEMRRMEYELELDEGRHQYECRLVVAGEDEVLAIVRDVTAQKRAEEALRASTLLLEKTFASLDEAVFVVEPNTRTIIACNSAAERVFGYSEKEMMGRNTEFLHVDRATYENFGRELFPALDAHGAFHTEYQLRRKDGSVLFTEHTVTEIVDDSGQRTGLVSVLRDITERKRAEDALRESEERYRMIVDNTNEMFYKVSLEDDPLRGSVEFVSGHIESILGYAPDDFLQNPELWLRLVHPDDVPAIGEITREILASRGPGTRQYRLRHKETGEYRWLEDKMVPLTDGDGNVVGYQGVARDITERKQAEEALRESEEQYRTLYEDNPSMYFTVDTAGTVLSVNRFGAEELGYTADELVGRSVLKVFYEPDREAVQKQLALCVKNPDQVADWEFRKVRKDGSMLWVKEAARAVRGPRGDTTVLIVCENISERKQAEEALRESDERYRALVESAFEGIVISRAGKILEANESFARMFGYELHEVIGLSPVEMTTPESAELIFNNVQSGFEKPYEITGIKKDGATISVEVIGKNCVYQGREARITAFRDITEIKRAEEARQQARDELEGRVEHQILRRNPYGLTFRELTVLHLVAAGKSDKEIGIDLGISPLTARKHLSNILAKMGAASRTEAVARGLREGLLD